MKKFITVCLSLLLISPMLIGQEQEVKKDHSELFPKAGNFSLGLDMSNMIKFIGNSFSSNGRTNFPSNSMVDPSSTAVSVNPTIYGRYFLTDNVATRIRLGIGVNNSTSRRFVYDDVANIGNPFNNDPLLYEKTVDEFKRRNSRYELGIGLEKRKNLWRMQGYGGAEVFAAYIHQKATYTYGNAFSLTNQTPTTYDFSRSTVINATQRTLDTKGGNTIHYGTGLYAGADFFITRNISIGAEFNLFIYGSFTSEQMGTYETYELGRVYTVESKLIPNSTSFQTSQLGTFNLSVYF